jgi:hypothetical protein
MVLEANGRMSRRNDAKYFLYLPKNLVEDSGFPFKVTSSVSVRVLIDLKGGKLLVMPLPENRPQRRKKRVDASLGT